MTLKTYILSRFPSFSLILTILHIVVSSGIVNLCAQYLVKTLDKEKPFVYTRYRFMNLEELDHIMVTIYSKNNCVQCKMTKRFLDSNNIAYREINLDEQPEFIEQVKELGFSAAPIIQTPTEVFSGFQPAKLKKLA